MPKLGKNTIALTAKFDCDRFLRLRLASKEEKQSIDLSDYVSLTKARPGIELVQRAGVRWETDKYNDLLETAGESQVAYRQSEEFDEEVGRHRFEEIEDLFSLLRDEEPPQIIIEGAFQVPFTITPALEEARERYDLNEVKARPDLLWIRPYQGESEKELIGPAEDPEFVIRVIDVKMAAEPSLRHFTEVTFYALALAEALDLEEGLAERYAICAQGYIWPGTHDAQAFMRRYREFRIRREDDPLAEALFDTLEPVPYEVYHAHVIDFFENRLLPVLEQPLLQTDWHVAPKCQLCDFLFFCKEQAEESNHLSRIPRLTGGQANLLRENEISTVGELVEAIEEESDAWQQAERASPQLRAEGPALLTRARALEAGHAETVSDRRTIAMPRYSDMKIFLTVHFDPGSGITFAMGARRVYFPPDYEGGRPEVDEHAYVVDRADGMDLRTERARLLELLRRVNRWLREADETNRRIVQERIEAGESPRQARRDHGRVRVHFYFWDRLGVTQLKRMLRRHVEDQRLVEELELLIRMFPPDDILPDPEAFKSQPGTVLKDVMTRLIGLPVPHSYTLYDAYDTFYPDTNEEGEVYEAYRPYGFHTEMSDQIPFERAYELWEDRILLTRRDNTPYERQEIRQGIEETVLRRLRYLSDLEWRMTREHGDLLALRKSAFSLAESTPLENVPQEARNAMALQILDVASDEIEKRQQLALPVEEREARFISIRGLRPVSGHPYDEAIRETRERDPRYEGRELRAFTFSPESRDARIRERDFTLAISNEEDDRELYVPWRQHLGISKREARELMARYGYTEDNYPKGLLWYFADRPLSLLLGVEVARLESMEEPPYLVLSISEPGFFQLAQDQGLVDIDRPLILDPIHADFSTKQVKNVLRAVSGYAAQN